MRNEDDQMAVLDGLNLDYRLRHYREGVPRWPSTAKGADGAAARLGLGYRGRDRVRVRFLRTYLLGVGNALSQLLGVLVGFTSNGNESVSGTSEWRAQERTRYRVARDAIDWVFGLFGQKRHCFDALYLDYLNACWVKQQFEDRYGEIVYAKGDPVPQWRDSE